MTDLQLRYFLICAEEGSLTGAANRLSISQPALSQQIRQLELSLKITLFSRGGRGITLTSSGNKLWLNIQPLFDSLDSILLEAKHQEGVSEGTISIAGVHSILPYLLPKLIADHAKSNKEVKFKLYTRSSQEVIQLVNNRTVDFGLVYENIPMPPEISVHSIFEEQLVAIFSPKFPLASKIKSTKRISADLPIISLPQGYALRKVINHAFHNTDLNIKMEVETLDMMLSLCQHESGICFAPKYVMNNRPDLDFCVLDNIDMKLSMALITKHRREIQPIAKVLIDKIKTLFLTRRGKLD